MIPNTGVSTTVVGQELGVATRNVRELCTSSNINKWSKHKPVKFNGDTQANPNWYKANDGFCGLSVGWSSASDSSLTNLVNAYKAGTWNYIPPTGGPTYPYRLGDFRGYNHKAVPFIGTKLKKGSEFKVNLMVTKALTFNAYYNFDSTTVQITDFNSAANGLQDAHLGIALYEGNPIEDNYAKRILTAISDNKITEHGAVTLNFDRYDIGASRYAMFFLASPTVSNNVCIPYDDDNYFIFKINIVQEFPIRFTPIKAGNSRSGYYDMSHYSSNNFPSSNGQADVIFYSEISNDSDTNVTIGSVSGTDYSLRTMFDSRYTTALSLCDASGNALTDKVTVNAKSTYKGYFKAPRMFLDFVNTWNSSTTQSRGILYIQAYNRNGGAVATWDYISDSYPMYVGR